MPIRTLLGLIACNLVWSAHPIMGKLLLESFPPAQAAWLRYASGLLVYAVAVAALSLRGGAGRSRAKYFMLPRGKRDLALVVGLGAAAFCFSPLAQMTGLLASRATDNALIVALEPLMTVLIAWVVLKDRVTRLHFVAFAVALVGFGLLARTDVTNTAAAWDPHFVGNLILLLSLTGEALYSTLGRKLIGAYPPTAVFGSALVAGVLCLTLGTAVVSGLPAPAALFGMSMRSGLALLWMGPLGTTLAYLYWMRALPNVPIASLALTLFIQPLFGPIWGFLFLDEKLTPSQTLGSLLILLAVFSQTWLEIRPTSAGYKKV